MRHNFLKRATIASLLSALLIGNVSLVWAQAKQTAPPYPASVRWKTYHNARFGYRLSYPASLIPQGEPDNGDGQRFISPNAETKLLVYGSNNVLDETIAARFTQEQRGSTEGNRGRVVTYAKRKANGYVVSGYEKRNIFYRKCYLVDDHFVTFEITYPKAERAVWDSVITRIGKEFQP